MKKVYNAFAFMFPGVGMEYKKYLALLNDNQREILQRYFYMAKKITGMDVWEYLMNGINWGFSMELLEQVCSYTISCCIYELYRERGIYPSILSGYSMGIYSAIACGGAISFETGYKLIINAYELMRCYMGETKGTMAVVVGLTRNEIQTIITKESLQGCVEIANENNNRSIVVSGLKESIPQIINIALNEGALNANEINVSLPYHSRFVSEGAEEFFRYVKKLRVKDLEIPIVSCINQEVIHRSTEVKSELYNNLKCNISWKKAVEKIKSLGINRFAEVGMGDSLIKVSRFIDGSSEFAGFDALMKNSGEIEGG